MFFDCHGKNFAAVEQKLLHDGRKNNIMPWKKSFVKNTSGKVEKQLKNSKNLKNFRKRPNASNCFRMHPNASQWVRMDPKASKSSRKAPKTCENFEKLRKNFAKKIYTNFFHGVVCCRTKPAMCLCSLSSHLLQCFVDLEEEIHCRLANTLRRSRPKQKRTFGPPRF